MFKKSLQILIACTLLALTAVIAFSLMRYRGPEDDLALADRDLRRGAFGAVVARLNRIEHVPSITSDPELRARLWRLRADAEARLGNPAAALRDISRLRQDGREQDPDLRLEEIALLARAGAGDRARHAARQFLGDHPGHVRGLELAGEACQTAYQPQLRALRERVDAETGEAYRDDAHRALLSFLYRPDGDAETQRARDDLQRIYAHDPRLAIEWPVVHDAMRRLREQIQEALGYFRDSLDGGGEPVAAFRAFAIALQQAGRIDDLLVACEIQRRRFDHAYVLESGSAATWALVLEGLPEAAEKTAARWLDTDSVAARAEAGRLNETAEQLALARTVATFDIGTQAAANRSGSFVHALRSHDLPCPSAMHLSIAARSLHRPQPDQQEVAKRLSQIVQAAARAPTPVGRPDLVARYAPLWIDALEAMPADGSVILDALALWRQARPDHPEPHARTARFHLQRGETAAAFAALDDAEPLLAHPAELFALRVRIAERHYADGTESGTALLAQCLQGRRTEPDVTDPIGYVLCAIEALRHDGAFQQRIAENCARRAVLQWPLAQLPRELELRAALRTAHVDDAVQAAVRALEHIEPDARLVALALEACERAGTDTRDIVRKALPLPGDSLELSRHLVAITLDDAPAEAERFVNAALTDDEAGPLSHALAARAYAAAGRLDRARALVDRLPRTTDPATATQIEAAFCAWLRLAAEQHDDDELLALARPRHDRLIAGAPHQSQMLEAAAALASKHPRTALELLQRGLADAPPEQRTGARYQLAGELATRLAEYARAAEFWFAALGFEDGQACAEPLARLLLLQQDPDRAARVYALVTTPTDAALAARFGKLSAALQLVAADLRRSPADLLTHALLASFGQTALVDWTGDAPTEVRQRRLELLAGLRDPHLGGLCLPRAQELLTEDPQKRVHYLLLARASCDAGLPAATARLHHELFHKGLDNLVLWREVAYAADTPGYVPPPKLLLRVMQATTAGKTLVSPRTLAYGTEQAVRAFEAAGAKAAARQLRLLTLRTLPQLLPFTLDDLALLRQAMSPLEACRTIVTVLAGPHELPRRELLACFYELATDLLESQPAAAATLVPAALTHLGHDGPRGDLVHFLLRAGELDVTKGALGDTKPIALLRAHLDAVANGTEPDDDWFERTFAELLARRGLEATARSIDELLARYPTRLPLWARRATLAARLGDAERAVPELRQVLRRASAPRTALEHLAIAATHRVLTQPDFERFDTLPESLRQAPLGRYVEGMLALRRGDPAAAAAALEHAAPMPDGQHLFARALALLQDDEPASLSIALELFEQLVRDYPSSSLAQNAGSFARQLAPR